MSFGTALIFLSLATGAGAEAPVPNRPPVVERLCGKLIQTWEVPVRGEKNSFMTKERNLGHVTVHLFSHVGDQPCCEGTAAATSTTGHWGGFQLKSKGLSAGFYWLEIEPDGHSYKLLIEYSPKKYSDQLCTQTVWEVTDAGEFRKEQFVVVD